MVVKGLSAACWTDVAGREPSYGLPFPRGHVDCLRGRSPPSLPGCLSQGMTKEEAIRNIREAIKAYISVLEEDGLPVPEERFELLTVAV